MKKNKHVLLWTAIAAAAAAALLVYFFLVRPGVPARGRRVVRHPGANVLLITLDTTRPDRLGTYGFTKGLTPEIDRLAHEGVLFQNAYSPVPLTLPSHASILTGTHPLFHGVRNNGKYLLVPQAVTLAEILKGAGYETAAFVSSFILDSRFGLDQGFEYYGDRMDDESKIKNLESERRAESVYRDFEHWLQEERSRPFFAWVHFFDPHYPYDPPEPYRSNPRLPDPYDGEIAYMDEYVGKTIRLIEEKGVLDSTVVILAGDHGEAFGEHKEKGHTIFCYEENIRVPFILFGPRFWPQGVSVPGRVGLIDILPTVLDLVRIRIPNFVQGQSVIPLVEGRRFPERDFYFESMYSREVLGCAPLQGLLSGRHKFIRLPSPELYDLDSDPHEKRNAVDAQQAQAAGMLKRLADFEKRHGASEPASERALSPEERERLRSLGYLSSQVQPASSSASGPDPKDRIEFWNRSQLAGQLLAEKKFAAAENLLLALLEEDPQFNPVIENLGELYFSQKRIRALMDLFEKTIEKNPQSSSLRIIYGRDLIRSGLAEKAVPVLETAEHLAGPDEMEQVHFTLGSAFGQLGRYEEAVESFRKALDLEPENFEAARLLGYSLMQLGKFEEALKYFGDAEKGMPENPRLLEDTAMSLAELRRFEEAIPYFNRAVKVNPAAPIYANYALACAGKGDYARAISLMEKVLSLPDASAEIKELGRRFLAEWRAKQ